MAMAEIPTLDTEQTTLRPVVMDIVKQLIKITGTDPGTRIVYPGTIGVMQQIDSNLTPHDRKNIFAFGDQLFVEVMADFDDARIMSTAVFRGENQPIFYDETLNVWIRPVFSTSRVTLNFRQRFKDKVSAFKWRDELKNRVSIGRQAMVFEVDYNYTIPHQVHSLLTEIYTLREKQGGYGDTLEHWMRTHYTSRATVVTPMNGKHPDITIAETQVRVQGHFDFEGRPDPGDAEDTGPVWYMNYQFTFQYDVPTAFVAGYPIVIHNNLIHKDYRRSNPTPMEMLYRMDFPWSLKNLYEFESGRWPDIIAKMEGITIPPFDDYYPSGASKIHDTSRIFTCLLKLNPDNPGWLVKLDELGKRNLNSLILDFMKTEAKWLTKPMLSVLNLSLYKEELMVNFKSNPITVDKDLNVIANNPMDIRKTYHLHLSIVTDWALISRDAKDRLRSNACVVKKLARAINPWIDLSFIKPVGGPCGLVPWAQMEQLQEELAKSKRNPTNHGIYQFNTVELFYVDTSVNYGEK